MILFKKGEWKLKISLDSTGICWNPLETTGIHWNPLEFRGNERRCLRGMSFT